MDQRKSKRINYTLRSSEFISPREKLEGAIIQFESNLLMDIRVYLKQFRLAHLSDNLEEVWSQVKISALRNAGNYNPACSAKAWLRTVAFHSIQHLYRNQKKQLPVSSISDVVTKFGFEGNVEEASETELFDYLKQKSVRTFFKEQSDVDEILSVVNKNDRRILNLRFVAGLNTEEIAKELGISKGAAYVRLSRAKDRLREGFLKQ